MHKKNWIIDIALIVIIIVMGSFVYIELNRMFDFFNENVQTISPTEISISIFIEEPTKIPTIDFNFGEELDQPAPEFELVSLNDEPVRLSNYLGSAVMLNFWASWCAPCRDEMPVIQAFAEQHADDLVVIAVNVGEDKAVVESFLEQMNIDLIVVIDTEGTTAEKFRAFRLPTSIFIDQDGVLRDIFIGELNEEFLAAYLSKIGVN